MSTDFDTTQESLSLTRFAKAGLGNMGVQLSMPYLPGRKMACKGIVTIPLQDVPALIADLQALLDQTAAEFPPRTRAWRNPELRLPTRADGPPDPHTPA